MYRQIYITHVFKGNTMPTLEEMEQLAHLMGHSVIQQLKYIKNDAPSD